MDDHQINNAVEAVTSVISRANREVLISTGQLDHRCYEDKRILDIIEKKKNESHVRFLVLSGRNLDVKSEKSLKLLRDDIYILNEGPSVHFTVADGKHFRLESRDPSIDNEYKNEQRFNDSLNGHYLRDKFFDALSRASKYTDLVAGVQS